MMPSEATPHKGGVPPRLAGPRVSVCIPAYNYAHFLPDAIESVLAQTFDDLELIICDNASTDNTHQIVGHYDDRRIRYLRYKINVPLAYNFNRCLEEARGEFVLVLCADDMLAPETVQRLVESIDRHPSAALAIAYQRQTVDDNGKFLGEPRLHPHGPGFVRGSELLVSQLSGVLGLGIPSQVLARTDVIISKRGFDPLATLGCDHDLWCRVCEDRDVVYVEDAMFYYRAHAETQTLQALADTRFLRADFFVFGRLFTDSAVLSNNSACRRVFIKTRMYYWFERELGNLRKGRFSGIACFLVLALKYEPLPWWLPYFLAKYMFHRFGKLVRPRKAARLKTSGRSVRVTGGRNSEGGVGPYELEDRGDGTKNKRSLQVPIEHG